jgi:hypothetical protein
LKKTLPQSMFSSPLMPQQVHFNTHYLQRFSDCRKRVKSMIALDGTWLPSTEIISLCSTTWRGMNWRFAWAVLYGSGRSVVSPLHTLILPVLTSEFQPIFRYYVFMETQYLQGTNDTYTYWHLINHNNKALRITWVDWKVSHFSHLNP